MADGLQIVQTVYMNLRKPSETALPYKTILNKTSAVVKKKKLDLSLSEQNALMNLTSWFTPNSTNYSLSSKGVFLPVRVERREIGSILETGAEVPIVNYQVLNTSENGAISFFGSPLRMVFRDNLDYVQTQQYRIGYEPDFSDEIELGKAIDLPEYFSDMIADEVTFDTIDLVEDNSPEWVDFLKRYNEKLVVSIADWRKRWDKYVKMFKGKAVVPKRTFLQNRRYCYPKYTIRRD